MLKQIKYFQAVVRCKSFTEAAEECYLSQSAISQRIMALEQNLGVKLLIREKRKFALTPAGEYFYQRSLGLMEEFEKICCETNRLAHETQAELRIGYLKGYGGQEFHQAVAVFTAKYPHVSVQTISGNHEDLYDAMRMGKIDLKINDQRRAFSDEYVNYILHTHECYVELAAQNADAQAESIEVSALQEIPCILIASHKQQSNESAFYRNVVGVKGEIIFAESFEEARLLVLCGKGYLPIEGGKPTVSNSIRRLKLLRQGKPIKRNYCAFWLINNSCQ